MADMVSVDVPREYLVKARAKMEKFRPGLIASLSDPEIAIVVIHAFVIMHEKMDAIEKGESNG